MTNIQRRNLAVLCLYVASLPKDYAHFDMKHYHREPRSDRNGGCDYSNEPAHPIDANVCGTSACFCGHGPNAGVLPLENETWENYAGRNFTADDPTRPDLIYSEIWNWLFNQYWPSDIAFAVKRAAWLLQTGSHPEVREESIIDEYGEEDPDEYTLEFDIPDGWEEFIPDFDLIKKIAYGCELQPSVN